ncbi:MAG: hypothetical protein E7603_04900 [Ruminococcaceae bacterium]|nr:hypothetical protein [Oscillospiraceae bacterium]
MKKRRLAAWFIAVLMLVSVLSGCAENHPQNGDELKSMEPVGEVPEEFKEIVENDIFNGVTAFDGRLLKAETIAKDEENRTVTYRVLMMDLYGKTMASYTCTSDDAYHINALTATEDGGFLFVLGFSDYAYSQNEWASDQGFASRVIKCDQDGQLQFETVFDGVEGYALNQCFEKNGSFYFFGTIGTTKTNKQGNSSPSDVYMALMDKNGTVLKTKCIAGSDYDSLDIAEISGDFFVLSISSQSDDGNFEGSRSKGYPKDWIFTVDDNFEIVRQQKKSGRAFDDYRIGEKDGVSVYRRDALLKNFDAGTPMAFIDYGDFYLIVSDNMTGIYENTPPMISSIWYYTETVYSAYDNNGKLIFRATVDSSPDYDSLMAKLINENNE